MARLRLLLLGLVIVTTSGCAAVTDVFDRSLLGQALGRSTVVANNRLCSYPLPCGPVCGPGCGGGPGITESHSPPAELLAPPRPLQNGPLAKPVPYNP